MEVVRANGLGIAYERVGEGPPLVLVHGATLDGRIWQPQLAGHVSNLDRPDEFNAAVRELRRGHSSP